MTLPTSIPLKFLLAFLPVLGAVGASYAAMSVDRDRNAQTRQNVAQIEAGAPADAAWRQHIEDRLDATDKALERIEHAVGSK